MTNLNILETFRTKEELINYFDEMGKNITEEEIEALKKSYAKVENATDALTMQQLNEVAGGGIWYLRGVLYGKDIAAGKYEIHSCECVEIMFNRDAPGNGVFFTPYENQPRTSFNEYSVNRPTTDPNHYENFHHQLDGKILDLLFSFNVYDKDARTCLRHLNKLGGKVTFNDDGSVDFHTFHINGEPLDRHYELLREKPDYNSMAKSQAKRNKKPR